MGRLLLPCLVALLAVMTLPGSARAQGGVADEIIVMREGGLTRAELAQAGVGAARDLPLAGVEVVSAGDDRAHALAELRADPDVAWAEPNRLRRVAAEPLAGLLWGLHNTGQSVWWQRGTADADVDAPEAWTLSRGAGVTVAVVDTGVDSGHPDLAGRLAGGYDFVEDDADPQDGHGHGTHVTGTIAAAENGAGVIGVAPSALVMPLRVLDASGSGSSADVAAAFALAGDRGVRVVNASLGSHHPSFAELQAIRSHPQTLYVVAAGNGGDDGVGDNNDGADREYPCAYTEPNVLCVGATDPRDARAAFSNYGAASVDLFAPGVNIVSTYPRGRSAVLDQYFHTGDGYEIMQGTSMASPHAAGAAALAAAVRPDWTPDQVKASLLDGADRLPGLAGASVTGARLNAAAAVRIAAGAPATPTTQGPLGPDGEVPGEAGAPGPAPGTPVTRPRISRMRITGTPRVCRRDGCQSRTATLLFRLSAEASVAVNLERRRCARERCAWRATAGRSRRAAAGRVSWTVGPRLLGMRLGQGAWRVTLSTQAGSARRVFRVR